MTDKQSKPDSPLMFTDGQILNQVVSDEALMAMEHSGGGAAFLNVFTSLNPDPYGYYSFTQEISDLIFSCSMIARRAVNTLPEKAFSLLKSWEPSKGKAGKDLPELLQVWRKILKPAFISAGQMARKYDDAYVVLFFDDTSDLSLPLSTKTATKLIGAVARSRWSVNPMGGGPANASSYSVSDDYTSTSPFPNNTSSIRNIHPSRIIHVPGLIVDDEQKRHRGGYNMSVFAYLGEPLAQWVKSNHAGIDMMTSHSVFTLGLAGLAWKTSNKDISSLKNRFQSILMGLKRIGGLLYDKDQETANFISRSYTGVDNLLAQLESYLVNSSDIPKEYLLNSGSSPFSEEGLGSRYAFASVVESYQHTHVSPIIDNLFPILVDVYGWDIKDISLCEPVYNSALVLTRKEEAEIRFKNAQTDTLYTNATTPVLSPEAILTHWEGGIYSDDITPIKSPPPPPKESEGEKGGKVEVGKLAVNAERGAYSSQKAD